MKMNEYDAHQQAVLKSQSQNILVVAGPGSGKTRVLVGSIQWLTGPPERVAAITYTNAAAAEVAERIGYRIGFCGTLHSFCLRLLRDNAQALGLPGSLAVVDQETADTILAGCVKDLGYRVKHKGRFEARVAAWMPGDYPLNDEERVGALYYSRLISARMVTFDDILKLTVGFLRKGTMPAPPFDHLLVDEYQDASPVDHEIYDRLAIPYKFRVGDPDQAIYGFRGGDVTCMLHLAAQAEKHVLRTNYRSVPAICEAADRLIDHNLGRIKKTMTPARASGPEQRVFIDGFRTERDELYHVFLMCRDHRGGVAVLTRTNRLADLVAGYLDENGLKVMRPITETRPPDWRMAKLILCLMTDPENNVVASIIMRERHGAKAADDAYAAAMAAGQVLCQAEPVEDIEAALELLCPQVSPETMMQVRALRNALPPGATVSDLLLAMEKTTPNAKYEAEDGDVTVSTIHAAKGREWGAVVLPGWNEGVLPSSLDTDPAALEEERRLAYVAMTRAKDWLYISHADRRDSGWGRGEQEFPRSRFIAEAGL